MRFKVLIFSLLISACAGPHHDTPPNAEHISPPAGPPAFEPYTLDPCGDGPGTDETLLVIEGPIYVRTIKGRFVDLRPGRYKTKDRQRCRFEITSNGGYSEK